MQQSSPCQYLEWDSNFFNRRIGQLTIKRLDQDRLEEVKTWCQVHAIDCLYFLTDFNEANTIHLVETNGFRLVDLRMTFEKPLQEAIQARNGPLPDRIIRLSTQEDIPFLKAIARVSHHDSRFYYDAHFPNARCDVLYETWIEKSCQGYAEAVMVAEVQGQPVGYVSCHLLAEEIGKIGLVGVNQDAQGRGLGKSMITASLSWFHEHGVRLVRIVTQGRNIPAQRLYQKCGFLTSSVHLFYHKWYV